MTALYSAVIFFVVIDRFLKVLAVNLAGRQYDIIGDVFKFSLTKNSYIAFSLPLSGFWLNLIIGLVILILIYYLVRAWTRGESLIAVSLLAVVLGAVSNLFDRLRFGYVIDYFDLKYFTVFNLADALIISGVLGLLYLLNKKRPLKRSL